MDEPGTGGNLEIYSVEEDDMVVVEADGRSREEWRQALSEEEYRVLREKGTERAFTGRYWDDKRGGVYRCAGCGTDLFLSSTKFDSGTGWPSFWAPVSEANIDTEEDRSLFTRRTEVLCRRCGGHLGHVFPDGPRPSGLRYCMNGTALRFHAGGADAEEAGEEE
jgi:peptide-methionine (R)-S-oxide reductase